MNTLKKSHRCSPTVCRFISEEIGIPVKSHRNDETEVILINDSDEAQKIFKKRMIVKLFYQEHYRYNCFSRNWGESKGEDRYKSICVVLNKTTFDSFQKKSLMTLSPQTKNRLYVACSRARNNLYLVSEELIKSHKNNF